MVHRILLLVITVLSFLSSDFSFASTKADDWAQFGRFKSQNDSLELSLQGAECKAVFMGNSITEGWIKQDPDFFIQNGFINRGISGQTSYQMLLRFREDVINLKPEVVVINAGTNDIAENNHPYNEEITFGNIVSMAELAKANGINIVLTSILPAKSFHWNRAIRDVPQKIISLNGRIKNYAVNNDIPFVDYYEIMKDEDMAMNNEYSLDGIHPNLRGYKAMEPLILGILCGLLQK